MRPRDLNLTLRNGYNPFLISGNHVELEHHWRKRDGVPERDIDAGIIVWAGAQIRQYRRLRKTFGLPRLHLGDDSIDWSIYHFESPAGAYLDVFPVIHHMEPIVLPWVALETLRWRVRTYSLEEGAGEGREEDVCDAPTLVEAVFTAIAILVLSDQVAPALKDDARHQLEKKQT